MSAHAVPFYCPYCGEEDIEPHLPPEGAEPAPAAHGHGSDGSSWVCRACARAFRLRLTAISAPQQHAQTTTGAHT